MPPNRPRKTGLICDVIFSIPTSPSNCYGGATFTSRRVWLSRTANGSFSTVTVAELLFGALRSREPEKSAAICRRFCSSFQVAALDHPAAEQSGAIRANREARGERIGAYDMSIAGIALARGWVLATHNVREFGRITTADRRLDGPSVVS